MPYQISYVGVYIVVNEDDEQFDISVVEIGRYKCNFYLIVAMISLKSKMNVYFVMHALNAEEPVPSLYPVWWSTRVYLQNAFTLILHFEMWYLVPCD